MPQARTAYGITYYAYSLHEWRALRSPEAIPRHHWPILFRAATNHERRNRINPADGAVPQLGGVDHIGAGFQDDNPTDLGAERLTDYGLNPNNTRASWHGAVDSNSICLLAPPDTRPWVHGVANTYGVDMNSAAIGIEDGILSPNWDSLPEPKRTAHYRMRAAWWALWFGYKGWPLIYTPDRNRVFQLAARGESWGLTQHADIDPGNRSDAGYVWRGGRRVNTFDYDKLFRFMREEMAIRTGSLPGTPNLPAPDPTVKALQTVLNDLGNTLDVDGIPGPLTEAAVAAAAADTGYTADITDHRSLLTHLEETMSVITEALDQIKANTQRDSIREAVWGNRFPGAGNNRADDITVATWRSARAGVDVEALALTLAAALPKVDGGQSVDATQLADAVVTELSARLTREEG